MGKNKDSFLSNQYFREATWEDSEIEIKVEVEFGDLPKELVTVELVCIKEMGLEEEISKEFSFVPLELEKTENGKAFYSIKYQLYGHGLRKVGVRVVPSNEILRRAYPELIKWY